MKRLGFALSAVAIVSGTLLAQNTSRPSDGDWPLYSRDLAGTKFSPLTQITAENVGRLTQAWTVRLAPPAGRRGAVPAVAAEDAAAPGAGRRGAVPAATGVEGVARGGAGDAAGNPPGNPEATPIVVNGVMYVPVAGSRILALDAETGKELWRHELPKEFPITARGVAFWPGDRTNPARIIVTAGPKLVALNASTGDLSSGFGKDGLTDIAVPWNGVPTIYKNVVVLGATVGELPQGPSGDTRAFDARSGRKLWEFHTVPRLGEKGHETWLDEGWKGRSGVNNWGWTQTIDEQRGILYMAIGGPAANYWGGDRPGANLFANSIVAVEAETGKYKWHFQTVHHDLWDSDMPSAPTLVDVVQNGRSVPALASIGKTGWMFILDRTSGKPLFGVEERPVPRGDAPGEWYSPTQPFPLKPPALSRVDFNKERDMVRAEDTSADHVAACQELWDKSGGFYNAGAFTPFSFHADGAPPRSTIQFPGGTGGVNWGGVAADPRTGLVFMNSHDTSLVGWIEKKVPGKNYGRGTEGSTQPYDRGSVNGAGPYFTFTAPMKDASGRVVNLPCQRPPWSRLIAVNANTGEIAWQTPLGINDALPDGKQHVGGSGSAGPAATAGGLVFVGATNDRRFRAFESKTGKELWSAKLDAVVNANPISYLGKNGKQYVAAVATDSVVVFALP